jgi:hypothetical protein
VRHVVDTVARLPTTVSGVHVVGDRRVKSQRLAAEWAECTAIQQGLPATIEDEATLRRIAQLLGAETDRL